MSARITLIVLGAPIAAIALLAFSAALLIEWLGDLARLCTDSENSR